MALIRLQNIGKIYVSEGNVAVGIRGVNLSFERGEFVAITGQSGSGKSTLLNVISGMDTYEEGELFIEDESTSHYVQSDWEEYRKKYISFIFQDYNIMESFTVLQNVELALMHIDDLKKRRERAMELIRRVGLEAHIKHRGSQLSGGQKQRTVIARALAKDSPVLLADEPTGNLDSQTSKEILALLREISHDKLVIVVTHNFEQVAEYATRHIRIFDGAVESDTRLREVSLVQEACAIEPPNEITKFKQLMKNGVHLGRVRFMARPKLSIFLCLLMCLSVIASALVTASSVAGLSLNPDPTLFTHEKGRVVIARKDALPIGEDELAALGETLGADRVWHYDNLLDHTLYGYSPDYLTSYEYRCESDASLEPTIGRKPEKVNEVMVSVPIGMQSYYGKDTLETDRLYGVFDGVDYTVVGVHYFYDNTQPARMIFTEEGLRLASAFLLYTDDSQNFEVDIDVWDIYDGEKTSNSNWLYFGRRQILISFEMEAGTYGIYFKDTDPLEENRTEKEKNPAYDFTLDATLYAYGENEYYYEDEFGYTDIVTGGENVAFSFDAYRFVENLPAGVSKALPDEKDWYDYYFVVSPDIWSDFAETYYEKTYLQASLFFADDGEAEEKAELLNEMGYHAIPSYTTQEADALEAILQVFLLVFTGAYWLMAMVLIAFVLNLCSNKAMLSTSGDIAIMRSMGISIRVIRISVYVQTLLALLPAFVVSAFLFVFIYTTPFTNNLFTFLHAPEYLLIALGALIIALRVGHRYVRKMFGDSVKKSLKGDVVK